MSVTFRWSGAVVLALAALSAPVQAQVNGGIRPPAVMDGPAATGIAGAAGGLGRAVPGINPVVAAAQASPYALSTVPAFNPYASPTASLLSAGMASPYGLSTYPGMFPPWGPYGFPPNAVGSTFAGFGVTLQGFASTIAATGQYEKDIQYAKIIREQARQASLDTARRALQYQWWYENQMLMSSSRRQEAERALELDRARKDPPETEIFSASALNTLLRSINTASKLSRGPNIPLEEETLKHVNLSGGTSPGNIGMLKDAWKPDWKPAWPDALMGDALEEVRASLTKSVRSAVNTLKDKADLDRATRNDIKGSYEAMLKKLNETDSDLTPSESIEARRFMNQLASAIKALSDPKAANYFNSTWNAKGKNVAELVDHMNREGLRFAPAASGDEAAYRALYQALRSFEVGLQLAQR